MGFYVKGIYHWRNPAEILEDAKEARIMRRSYGRPSELGCRIEGRCSCIECRMPYTPGPCSVTFHALLCRWHQRPMTGWELQRSDEQFERKQEFRWE
jgi:hypothetical protein